MANCGHSRLLVGLVFKKYQDPTLLRRFRVDQMTTCHFGDTEKGGVTRLFLKRLFLKSSLIETPSCPFDP